MKHTVHTDALDTLGMVLDETAERDAIHLAVEPVIAAHGLMPGQHVGLDKDGHASASAKHLGIVDPFLKEGVMPGERFWLVVYPRQITSLRHMWEHPDFPKQISSAAMAQSQRWLQSFCDSIGAEYGDVISSAIQDDGYYNFGTGNGGEIPDEFWTHIENVTGVKIANRSDSFTCSC